jgi:hypothetical protein
MPSTAVGHLYIVTDTDLRWFKLGYTADLPARVRSLQNGVPFAIELAATCPGTYALEAYCHNRLSPWLLRGEWYLYGQAAWNEALLVLREAEDAMAGPPDLRFQGLFI